MDIGPDLSVPGYVCGQPNNHPYSSSISSSASSSSSSVFSADGLSSQGSVCSVASSSSVSSSLQVVWETENAVSNDHSVSREAAPLQNYEPVKICSRPKLVSIKTNECSVSTEQQQQQPQPQPRTHPRRSNRGAQDARTGCPAAGCSRPPSLVRQSDRKNLFVDNLVDCSAQIVEVIWPLSVVPLRSESAPGSKGVLPLRTFIQETLRRSRTSYSTLQVALYYLILIRPYVPKFDFTMEQPEDTQSCRALQCGRRMFLSALILASKYLQDRNYSSRAWSKISGLNTQEINANEMTFLFAINWRLHISESVFARWTDLVLKLTNSTAVPAIPVSPISSDPTDTKKASWATIVPQLTPELDMVELDLQHPSRPSPSLSESSVTVSPISYTPPFSLAPSSSNGSTPIPSQIPRVLEPTPTLTSMPSLKRLCPLPTPQMTPQSAGFGTPSSTSRASSRRSSICAAFEMASCRATSPPLLRCSPHRLPRIPSLQQIPATYSRKRTPPPHSSSPLSCLDDAVAPAASGALSSYGLQRRQSSLALGLGMGTVLEDQKVVASPITMAEMSTVPMRDYSLARKRRCCGEEAGRIGGAKMGPGMWDGIL